MRTVNTDFLKQTCCLTLKLCAWGNRRKGNIDTITTDADKTRLGLSKKLIESEEYDAIRTYLGETRKWITSRTMPFLGFKGGIYLSKAEAVPLVEAELPRRQAQLAELVTDLRAVWAEKVDESAKQLAGQFNEKDYPTADQLDDLFSIEWNWVAFTVPEGLPPELRAVEAAKLEAKFEEAGEEILQALRSGFAGLIDHAVDRLKTEPGAKPKIFRDTLLGNITEFLDTFSARNLMNDTELGALVERARGIVTGISPQNLRESEALRERTLAKFQEVREAVGAMITERPARSFALDE